MHSRHGGTIHDACLEGLPYGGPSGASAPSGASV